MKKYTVALLCIYLLIFHVMSQGEVTQDSLGDLYFPELGNGGYDVLHYNIDLTPDFDTETLDATVVILIEATQALNEFNLDFWGFSISELVINGKSVNYRRDGIELTIIPEETLDSGEVFAVAISYNGTPRDGLNRQRDFLSSPGWVFHDAGSFVLSEPRGASLWFPANDHPQDKATYSFQITVPEPYVVATSGQIVAIVNENGMLTYKSETNDLTASYLVTIHIGDFVLDDSQSGNLVPVRNYFARPYEDEAVSIFSETSQMIAFYEDIIGEYPFDVYGSIVADVDLPFALETQTLSSYGTRILEDSIRTHVTLAHETVHQWFGNSVSPARWQDIWLNEGFASYLSLLWAEEKYGANVFQIIIDDWYERVTEQEFLLSSPEAIGNPSSEHLFHGAVYWKGALTLHALRLRLGDSVFFEIIRTYYQQYRDSHATIEDFIMIANDVSGDDLTAFFDSWLYQQEVPQF